MAPLDEVVDPVCGEVFPPGLAAFESMHAGHKVWFCSITCKQVFDEAPQEFPLEQVEGSS